MTKHKWVRITIMYDDGMQTDIHRYDLEKILELNNLLEAVSLAKRTQRTLNDIFKIRSET